MPRKNMSSLSIPKRLFKEAEGYVKKNPQLGYSSVAELVKEILRTVIRGKEAS